MRTIAHISDIHFGREDPALVDGLLKTLARIAPDVIAISGDLTQRARVAQFKQAAAFIDALPITPRIVVPGNHDISTTNLAERLVRPLARYQRYITRDLEPFLLYPDLPEQVPEIAFAGINTVRVLSTKDGRINRRQVASACQRLSTLDPDIIRIVVTHHPMDLPREDVTNAIVHRARKLMQEFADCKVDLFLSGHLHTGHSLATSDRYNLAGYSAIVAQAGTAVSTRTRGEANSWNLIGIEPGSIPDSTPPVITIQQILWDPATCTFAAADTDTYHRLPAGWTQQPR